MRATIHDAAARVLAHEGAAGFNTNRVAAVAGISVGSLYQYYPNKTALLLELYEQETYATWAAVEAKLFAPTGSPRERFSAAIRFFFRTEADEAPMRSLIAEAAIALSETEAFAAHEQKIAQAMQRFLRKSLGSRVEKFDIPHEAELVLVTVSSVAEHFTRDHVRADTLMRWAETVAAMLADRLGLR